MLSDIFKRTYASLCQSREQTKRRAVMLAGSFAVYAASLVGSGCVGYVASTEPYYNGYYNGGYGYAPYGRGLIINNTHINIRRGHRHHHFRNNFDMFRQFREFRKQGRFNRQGLGRRGGDGLGRRGGGRSGPSRSGGGGRGRSGPSP